MVRPAGNLACFRLRLKRLGFCPVLFLILFLFLQSCGIEVYHYLRPISTGDITTSLNQEARINLSNSSSSSSDFTHFAMYYRIYLSYSNRTGFSLSANDLRDINQTLYYDYNYLGPYTDTTSATTVNVASVMANRGYQPLYFELSPYNYSSVVLDSPGTAELYFPPSGNPNPYLRYSGIGGDLFLIRSNGGGSFYPRPASRRFLNTAELSDPAYINQNANADVVAPSGTGSTRYAYVSIYVATAGINEGAGYVPIFSNPTFVGIFQIPAASSP
jgi:hypothetical protein